MKKPWIPPLIILIMLLLIWIFRWDYTASKSHGDIIEKWKIDRWSGQRWVELYSPRGYYEIAIKEGQKIDKNSLPSQTKKAKDKKDLYTGIWRLVIYICIAWLMIVFFIVPWLKKKKDRNNSI